MNVFEWLTGQFASRGRALSRCRRGMRKARNNDHEGAIDDYTTTIAMRNTPADVKARAQYNRALVHLATKDDPKAIEDLNLILAMKETLINVKTMAKQKHIVLERRSTKSREQRY